MAKQNFLNGGYIGKLGNTVGQRWKDKKIVRTYVIPANPNTPAQQTARQQFATANKLAQQAMNINGHTGVWDTSTKPEYSQRVGQAMKRLRLGYSEQDSLPLYPEGQSPAVGLSITDVTYNEAENKYIFQTQGFALNNPLATEITFFTPLNYAADKYQENIIHGTVDSQNGTFTVDLSANNQADNQLVKTLFQNAMRLGFCAMKATFYDALGIEMPNISISRKFKVTNKIYDFDESLTMLDAGQKVTFTQAFSQNRIEGTITPFQSAGFPIVYRLSVETQYYGGLVGETAESSFITMGTNQNVNFTVPVTPTKGHLQETTATTYGLTVGATQPQITKDVSRATYQLQIIRSQITDIVFAANTITINLNQNIKDFYANAGEITITYKDLSKWPAMTNSTISGAVTIAPNGNSLSITNSDIPKLGGVIIGSIELAFTDNLGAPITGLEPDKTVNVAGKYYYSNLQKTLSITQTASTISDTATGGVIQASFKATAVPAIPCVYQNAIIVTYKDNVTEFFLISGIKTAITTTQNITVNTTANAGKEIIKVEVITLAAASSSANASAGWTAATAYVPVSVSIADVIYSAGTNKYTFSTQGFRFNNPATAEIAFFTPLNYTVGKYQENTIHATVNAQAKAFIVDISANNQADAQPVKTLFKNTMDMGFCAMKATFYDAQGNEMNHISISRKYKITNKLYDFDETKAMLTTTNKVNFTQAFSQNRIQGTITPFQTTGFPIVYRLSVETQYYGGLVAETAESSFITMNTNQNVAFTVPVTPTSGNLQETTATTYALAVGATQPQIIKDTSTEAYPMPIRQVNITDVAIAGNTITFTLDQNIRTVGATGGTATIRYRDLVRWPTVVNSTITASITIATGGTTCSITNTDVPKLGGIILGQLNLEFIQTGGATITGLSPDPKKNVAGKYYYSTLENKQTITQTNKMLTGKSIGGIIKTSFKATTYPAGNVIYQNAIKTTYEDGQSEVLLVAGTKNTINTETTIQVTTAANAGKEIVTIEVVTFAVKTDTTANNTGWTSSSASVPASFTLPQLYHTNTNFTITFTLPQGIPSYLGKIGGTWKAWESTSKGLRQQTIAARAIPSNRVITLDTSEIGADSIENGAPIFLQLRFFYEDNTPCTTTKLIVPPPLDHEPDLVVPFTIAKPKTSTYADIRVEPSGDFEITFNSQVFLSAGISLVPCAYTLYDENGSEILEGSSENQSKTTNKSIGVTGTTYQTGNGIVLAKDGQLLFYYYENDTMNLVAVI